MKYLKKFNEAVDPEDNDLWVLEGGELIEAQRDLRGVSNSYNTPERIEIKKGAVLRVPGRGTNRGDVFCDLVSGEIIKHRRSMYGEDPGPTTYTAEEYGDGKVGLSESHGTSYPQDLGKINLFDWKIVDESVMENAEYDGAINSAEDLKEIFSQSVPIRILISDLLLESGVIIRTTTGKVFEKYSGTNDWREYESNEAFQAETGASLDDEYAGTRNQEVLNLITGAGGEYQGIDDYRTDDIEGIYFEGGPNESLENLLKHYK